MCISGSKLTAMIGSCVLVLLLVFGEGPTTTTAHEAKDFDDSILYKIDFEIPDFDLNPNLKEHLRTFYTHENEKYDCVIPVVEDAKEELKTNEPELSPYALLQPIFTAPSCSYRIEAYWSYEICHGHHVRQYHEEREGKNVKFQEYYLGKWNELKAEQLVSAWEESRKAGVKYKTTKIEHTKYPFFEVEMGDGTMCDIVDSPRTTIVRYVCYPHGKNEIYSFKETSSCNYEAIILTSVLCMIPAFHPEESKEVSIKCFNTPTEPHKPLSMLRQELSEMHVSEDDFPVSKDANTYLNKFGYEVDKLVLELMAGVGVDVDTSAAQETSEETVGKAPIIDITPIQEFISGKNCLIGGTGWWKYEFCYGRHVRQFHKDKKSETELYLGFFSADTHRQWATMNPDKNNKLISNSATLWHHYDRGTRCDRTGLSREVDVKLTCTPIANSAAAAVSMYLLEPKTCQYILVVESPIVCDLLKLADEFGLVQESKLQQYMPKEVLDSEQNLAASGENAESSNKNVNEPSSETVTDTTTATPTATATISVNQALAQENVRA